MTGPRTAEAAAEAEARRAAICRATNPCRDHCAECDAHEGHHQATCSQRPTTGPRAGRCPVVGCGR